MPPFREDSPKARKRPPRKPTPDSLRAAALAYLERFPASTERLRRVLGRKIERYRRLAGEEESPENRAEWVESLIQDLGRAGYLDDRAYARGLARSLGGRGLSARGVEAKMRARGLAPETIGEALALARDEAEIADDFTAALRLARRKKLGPFALSSSRISPEKALAALARAGFDYQTAQRVMKTDRREAEERLEEEAR